VTWILLGQFGCIETCVNYVFANLSPVISFT